MNDRVGNLHLALAFDRNFIVPFYVLLTSIFLNNRKHKIVFHIIAEGVDKKQLDEITAFVRQNDGETQFYFPDKKFVEGFTLSKDSPHITAATYYRLFFPQLVPIEIDHLLYLDTDTVVIGDLRKLYETSLGQFPVGAVSDAKILKRSDLGIEIEGEYFNAGVLLINIKEWKLQNVTEKAVQFLIEYPEKILLADQDALNPVLANNWYKLDRGYNVTYYDIPKNIKKQEFDSFLKDKTIIHYTTQNKPWLLTCTNRLRYLYHHYFQQSPQAKSAFYMDESLRNVYKGKLFKRSLKEFLIDLGIPLYFSVKKN